ncbi:MAG: zinc ribbon domain-containing protein [bacterium]|nr:zinc ribbon domain-containing protein [bacterium]
MAANISPPVLPPISPLFAVPPSVPTTKTIICPQCHQAVPSTAYYCQNCGKQLSEPPLRTNVATQTWIYILSVGLPFIGFIAIKYWPGIKYAQSDDTKAKEIGYIAITLLTISTIIVVWLIVVEIRALQSTLSGALL